MLRRYVTAMTRKQFDDYGHDMLRSFSMRWPRGDMLVYSEDGLPVRDKRVTVRPLSRVSGLAQFQRGCEAFPVMSGALPDGRNYVMDAKAFSNKAFAQMDAAKDWRGYLFWIDSDVITDRAIPAALIDSFVAGHFMALMRRKTWHICTSFIGWDCGHAFAPGWWAHYRNIYEQGWIFLGNGWTDCHAVERSIQGMPGVRDIAEHVTGDGPYNVFDSVFAGYARHLKGILKKYRDRYAQLTDIVAKVKPQRLIEIGTWNGDRAITLSRAAPGLEYVGFDLFEDASDNTDAEEKNVKKHYTLEAVAEKLKTAGVPHTLFKGNSREQFARYISDGGGNSADLVYIDGGHSVETIAADFQNAMMAVKPGGLIVFDDYYSGMPEDEMQRFGAQAVLTEIPHTVLPVKDPVRGGGFTQMAVVQC